VRFGEEREAGVQSCDVEQGRPGEAQIAQARQSRGGLNMTKADEFRKQANDAREMATRALKQEDKAVWLRVAEDWIKLAQQADQSGESKE
jgi:gluconate kinase